tara:strand:- start:569 stop:745 length:177 start_codon:yes stop_codon:yes gene_type:complete
MNFLLYSFSLLCLIAAFTQTDKLNRLQARYDMLERQIKSNKSQEAKTARLDTEHIKYE